MVNYENQEELMAALVNGEEEAWAYLSGRPYIRRCLQIMKTRKENNTTLFEDGDDLAQDFMIELYRSLQSYHSSGGAPMPLEALAHTISNRLWADHLSKWSRRKTRAVWTQLECVNYENGDEYCYTDKYPNLPENNRDIDNLEKVLTCEEMTARIEQAVFLGLERGILHSEEIVIIKLYYYEVLNDREIAERMGCSVNTVKSRRQRALKKLEGLIGNYVTV